jgi:hypothetical protein
MLLCNIFAGHISLCQSVGLEKSGAVSWFFIATERGGAFSEVLNPRIFAGEGTLFPSYTRVHKSFPQKFVVAIGIPRSPPTAQRARWGHRVRSGLQKVEIAEKWDCRSRISEKGYPCCKGMLRTRLPLALKMALATAGARATIGVSPAPIDRWSFRSMISTSMLGVSRKRGTG